MRRTKANIQMVVNTLRIVYEIECAVLFEYRLRKNVENCASFLCHCAFFVCYEQRVQLEKAFLKVGWDIV